MEEICHPRDGKKQKDRGRSQGPPISLKGAPSMTCLLGTLACLPETQSHCVAQGGLQFGTLLPQVRIFNLLDSSVVLKSSS